MQRTEIKNLLEAIAVHYPSTRVNDGTIEEWYRLIGFMEYSECLQKLDDYLMQETGNRFPPSVGYFRKHQTNIMQEREVFHAPIEHRWHIEFTPSDIAKKHGRVFDQYDYEYVHDPCYEDGYHYDSMGRICTIDGKVAFL